MGRTKQCAEKGTDAERFLISQMYQCQQFLAGRSIAPGFNMDPEAFEAAALPLVQKRDKSRKCPGKVTLFLWKFQKELGFVTELGVFPAHSRALPQDSFSSAQAAAEIAGMLLSLTVFGLNVDAAMETHTVLVICGRTNHLSPPVAANSSDR